MRRAALAFVMAIVAGLAACGDGAVDCGDDATGPITFATVKNLSPEQRNELVSRWRALHPAEPLEIVVLPSTSDQQRAQLAATLQVGSRGGAGRREGYDVVGLDVVFLAEFARTGLLEELDSQRYAKSGFFEAPWDSAHWNHKLYAVPFTTNVGLLYYWPQELYQLGYLTDVQERWAPADWQTVLKAASASRQASAAGPVGYTGQLAAYEGLTANTLELIYGEDGALPQPGKPVTPDQLKGASAGIGFLLDGVRNNWIRGSALGFDEQTSLNAFADRQALILRHWPDAWATLAAADRPAGEPPVGVTRLPGTSAVLGGENLAVARCSPYRTTARDLLSFLTAPEQQQWIFRTGLYLPTRESLYGDGSLSTNGGPPADFVELLRDSVNAAQARPADAAWNATSRTIQTEVHGALERAASEPVDADDVVAGLADKLEQR